MVILKKITSPSPDILIELDDTPSSYDDGKFLQSTSSGTVWTTVSGIGGVSDHGELTGLSDDDHLQYHTNARADARYYRINFETFTLNGTDITNKYIDLNIAPKTDDSLNLCVFGGTKGLKDTDYTVSGTRIDWGLKDWDGILEAGDIIEVICYY